jgi:hypothetical protein
LSLRDHFVREPDSAAIAARLEAAGATACDHGLNPATLCCGVKCAVERLADDVRVEHAGTPQETRYWTGRYRKVGLWVVEPLQDRVACLEHIEENIRLDAEKRR